MRNLPKIWPHPGRADFLISRHATLNSVLTCQSDAPPRRLIVKAVPSGEASGAMVRECGFFQRERLALQDLLPALQRQLAAGLSHLPSHHLQLGPRAYTSGNHPHGALIMEDLAELVGRTL